jgi:pimeloyl-ACP methyl ester carboxylesterase
VEKPFAAYKGDLPYIFVCYAHEDSDAVFPEISWLHDQGVKIWYDEGISPGLEWTEALANAIQGSSKVLFFVTPHSVTSEHCRRELNFAQEEGHDVVAVHLADTEIPPGLRLSLNNRQAILRRELSDDRYRQELMQVAQTAVADPVEPDPQPNAAKSSGRWTGLALTKTRRVSHPWVWGSVGFLVVVLAASSVLFADRLTLWWAYNAPEWLGRSVTQQIRFTETTDGVRIAYATSGEGPVLVLVVGWFTHLERGPIYDTPDIVNALSSGHLLVRYDGRGFGMSDRDVSDFSLAARVRDLEAVVEAVGAEKVHILAVSKGSEAAVPYTAAHPEKVASLIIAAGTPGMGAIGMSSGVQRRVERMVELFRSDWESSAVRSMLSGSVAAGSEARQQEITEFLLLAGSGDAHAGFLEASMLIDVSEDAQQIRQSTLLLVGQNDQVLPLNHTRRIASLIPHAELSILPDTSHIDTMRSPEAIRLVLDFLRQQHSE